MAEKITLTPNDDSQSYDIIIAPREIASPLAQRVAGREVFVVTDENVARHHLPALQASLPRQHVHCFILPGGEETKSFSLLEKLLNDMVIAGIDRESLIIAFGGGVIGDLVGFAAATILRGVDYIQIPTTLLAQIDSAIGGKTGVNLASGKNLAGAFHQPQTVLIDPSFLETLEARELRGGYAEMIKYGLLDDEGFFEWLEENHTAILIPEKAEDFAIRVQAIVRSCRLKAEIVGGDTRENNRRALLNLGHSFGHAMEAFARYDGSILHGEAIAIGMVMAFHMAEAIYDGPKPEIKKLVAHLKKTGLPTSLSEQASLNKMTVKDFSTLMAHDKKNRAGGYRLVLPEKIGKIRLHAPISKNRLEKYLASAIKALQK